MISKKIPKSSAGSAEVKIKDKKTRQNSVAVTKKARLSASHRKPSSRFLHRRLLKNILWKKQLKKGKLKRVRENPILAPQTDNAWESWQTFNPGAVLLDDNVHLLYRAIGSDGLSRVGYAVSKNGFLVDERLMEPVYEHTISQRSYNVYSLASGGSWGGCEDPRIVRVDDEDKLYMTYTACDSGGLGVALTSIGVSDFLNRQWNWRRPVIISAPGEVHKNWVIFSEKINGKYAILHSINPTIQIAYLDCLDFDVNNYIVSHHGGLTRAGYWDRWVRGVGPPPIKTSEGWLLLYHAMNGDRGKYRVGAMLLDLNDPTKVLYRSRQPVLEPKEYYENNGSKAGVVYASGAVIKDGKLLIYYGAADCYVCVAWAKLDVFLDALKKNNQPKLNRAHLKKRWP